TIPVAGAATAGSAMFMTSPLLILRQRVRVLCRRTASEDHSWGLLGWHPEANHWRTMARSVLAIAVTKPLEGRVSKDRESVMKCSNPDCNRDIGLVSYR